mmetsp:Transcript_3360/g.5617  ORF Transcript_3360/g.5617 Transcript_3360/m.5617 type:complete len:229 (+) Transcript_3360:41-727(+)
MEYEIRGSKAAHHDSVDARHNLGPRNVACALGVHLGKSLVDQLFLEVLRVASSLESLLHHLLALPIGDESVAVRVVFTPERVDQLVEGLELQLVFLSLELHRLLSDLVGFLVGALILLRNELLHLLLRVEVEALGEVVLCSVVLGDELLSLLERLHASSLRILIESFDLVILSSEVLRNLGLCLLNHLLLDLRLHLGLPLLQLLHLGLELIALLLSQVIALPLDLLNV